MRLLLADAIGRSDLAQFVKQFGVLGGKAALVESPI